MSDNDEVLVGAPVPADKEQPMAISIQGSPADMKVERADGAVEQPPADEPVKISIPVAGTPLNEAREGIFNLQTEAARQAAIAAMERPVQPPTSKTLAEIEYGKRKLEEHKGRQAMLDAKRKKEDSETNQNVAAQRANRDLS